MRERRFGVCWVAAWLLLSALWCVTSARQIGATFDEPIYVTKGLERWRSGSLAGLMKLGTMPLPVDVQTLPLYLWERCRGRPIDPVSELHLVLPFARAATLFFWGLLLWHAWLAAASLGGRWAGALAVALLACEPILAAHASLATTDIAVTACLLALLYHFRASREGDWWRRVAWPAFWFALAVLAKASGMVFGAMCLFVSEAQRCGWWRRSERTCGFSASLKDLFQIGLLGMLLVFVYCGSDWQPQASLLAWAKKLPEGPGSSVVVWLAEHLRLFSNAGDGLMRQVTHNIRGHGSYLLGHTDQRAMWYYFPVVLSIKLSVPLLLAPILLAAVNVRRGGPWYGNWALLCAFALLVFSVTCRVQIGVRFMFPLVALAAVGLSAVLVRTVQSLEAPLTRRGLILATVAGLGWTVTQALAVWPEGLCYVNPLWGGTGEGYRLVSEANYDWGQGLKQLSRWQRRYRIDNLCVWYFGTDPALQRMPVQPLYFQLLPIHDTTDVLRLLRGHRLAAATTLVHGNVPLPGVGHIRAALNTRKPSTRVGTFLIYDFTGADDPTVSVSR
jgi:dolichyl-phosphate-mannose-protein mannosyltransferase